MELVILLSVGLFVIFFQTSRHYSGFQRCFSDYLSFWGTQVRSPVRACSRPAPFFYSSLLTHICSRELWRLHEQLSDYLANSKILPEKKWGFKRGFGPTTYLCHIAEECLTSINLQQLTSRTLLDMASAFDAVETLVAKLRFYRTRDTTLS